MRSLGYITLCLFLVSCFRPDEVLPPIAPQETTVNLSIDENQSAYIDLGSILPEYNESEPAWHLKFQNTNQGWGIYLNTLDNVVIHNTTQTDFDAVDASSFGPEVVWQMDVPTPEGLSPALGEWGDFSFDNPKSFKDVFLILWNDQDTSYLYKLQLLDATVNAYHLRYGPLNNDTTYSVWINKDSDYAHSYFSFKKHKKVQNVEPQIGAWDLCFTYLQDSIQTHQIFPEQYTINPNFGIYNGLLVNYRTNFLYLDTTAGFENIDYFYASKLEFYKTDQLFNTFVHWDRENNALGLADELTLLLNKEDKYYAIRATSFARTGPSNYSISLLVKQL